MYTGIIHIEIDNIFVTQKTKIQSLQVLAYFKCRRGIVIFEEEIHEKSIKEGFKQYSYV